MKTKKKFKVIIQRKLLKFNLDKDNIFFILTLVVGVGAAFIAVSYAQIIDFITHYLYPEHQISTQSIVIGACMVFVSGYITTRIESKTSGSGIPQTKIAYVAHHGVITFKTWFLKFISSVLSLGSGMSLGREGPTVTTAAGLGSSLGGIFSLSKSQIKGLLAVGASGGIAAAFNTPIAAVLFTLEEIVGNMNTKSLGPIVISSVIAAVSARVMLGGESIFSGFHFRFEDPTELPFYLIVGILAAFLGPLWVKFIIRLRSFSLKILKGHKLTYMMLTFFVIVFVGSMFPEVFGGGHHVIQDALQSKIFSLKTLALLFVLKFFFTSLCYSTGISGGLFMPTLFLGAIIGSAVGVFAVELHPGINTIGAFAMVGMGAFFISVIRAPFTSIIMIFEMTQEYKIILPLMIANITAFLISKKLMNGSIYEQIAIQDGVHLPSKEDFEILDQLTVEDAMIRDVKTLNYNQSIREAMRAVNRSEISGYPVMKFGYISGVVSTNDLCQAYAKFQGECLLDQIATKELITIHPDQSLMYAFHLLKKHKVSRLLVTSRENDRRLVGIITAEDIVNRFGFHIQEESKAELIDQFMEDKSPSAPI
tara:strand:- start:75778 stop:77553 length:1776 start_codon:yes stop_codon:yes gene_type:complete